MKTKLAILFPRYKVDRLVGLTGCSAIALLLALAPILTVQAADDRPLDQTPGLNESTSRPPTGTILPEPKTAPDFVRRGIEKTNQKDFEGAIVDFNQALQLKRDYALAYYHRGNAYTKINNIRAAIADYSQVILLKPNNAYVRYDRGILRANTKDTPGAIVDFQQAAALFKQQLNRPWEQKALDNIKQLQQS
ncbi:MAG: tetratricopeptide repeat protein [Lyngbya sp. HA4199-MV5]|jgi:tetratricopeptide (TPR) repeat protein|nr:tetratricopeptide repeat protein [Lyngbya sp. HA4199-MV5]